MVTFCMQGISYTPIFWALPAQKHVDNAEPYCMALHCLDAFGLVGLSVWEYRIYLAYKTWPLNHNKQNVRRLCRDSVTHSLASWKIRTASSSVLAEFHKKWPYTWFRDPNVFKTWLATDLYCIIYATRESVFLSKDPWHVRLVDYSVIV